MTWPPPESFVDALAGGIVGGILTALAGLLGLRYQRAKEKADEHTRFLAAVRVVLDELGANEVNLVGLTGQAFGRLEVYDATYRSVDCSWPTTSSTTTGGCSPGPMSWRERSGLPRSRRRARRTESA